MVRVLVCGEGPHDIGVFRGEETAEEGWLQTLLRNLLGDAIEIVAIRRNRLVLQRRQQAAFRPLPPGHGKKALACKLRAVGGKYDLVVFMTDADSNDRRRWEQVRAEILDGLGYVNGVRGAPCVPMSTSESWFLGDEQAWDRLGLEDLNVLPRRPESIWGNRRDRNSNHPRQVFRRVCDEADVEDSRETRVKLARALRSEAMNISCPISFTAFVDDLNA